MIIEDWANPTLTMLIGLPGTGKSTWIKNYKLNGSLVLSTDDIIHELALREEDDRTYTDMFLCYIQEAERLFWNRLERAILKKEDNIYIDRTNLSRKSRSRIFKTFDFLDMRKEYTVYAKVFGLYLPIHQWLKRLESRKDKQIPWDVLVRMAETFENPFDHNEGFDGISSYNKDGA